MHRKLSWLFVLLLTLVVSFQASAQRGTLTSDDFNGFRVNDDIWTTVNPLETASIRLVGTNSPDAWLQIDIPAGPVQDVWFGGIQAPRVMQQIQNADFDVEVRFETGVTSGQSEGVVVEADQGNWVQVFFTGDGSNTRLVAASAVNGVVNLNAPHLSEVVGPDSYSPLWLRLRRSGSEFAASYSIDGTTFTDTTPFSVRAPANRIGVYGGVLNYFGDAPAFTMRADYFVNSAAPITNEDAGFVDDVFAPLIIETDTLPYDGRAVLSWTTDEPSTARVEYGLTDAFELGAADVTELTLTHSVELGGLQAATTYNVRISSVDAFGNEEVGEPITVTTLSTPPTTPEIELWYGDVQQFGALGLPQRWVNVLGRVNDADLGDRIAMSFSLNGGPERPLSVGPDQRRLAGTGDFNVEIAVGDMSEGENQIVISARDRYDNSINVAVTVFYSDQNFWALPYAVNWADVRNIQSVVQIVDGRWTFDDRGARTAEPGYRRMITVGDIFWTEYDTLLSVTINALAPSEDATLATDPEPFIGLIPRWTGYYNFGPQQPAVGPLPIGAFARYMWRSEVTTGSVDGLEMLDGGLGLAATDESQIPMAVGSEYYMRMRVLSGVDDSAFYAVKIWRADQAEPNWWNIATGVQPGGTTAGSVAIIANRVDVTVNVVEINPLPPEAYLLAGYRNSPPECDVTVISAGANLRSGPGPNFGVTRSVPGASTLAVNAQRTSADGFVWYRAAEDNSWIRSDLAILSPQCEGLTSLDAPAGSN